MGTYPDFTCASSEPSTLWFVWSKKAKNGVASEPKMKVGNPRPRPSRNCQSDNPQCKRRFWMSRGIQSASPWLSRMTVARRWTCLQRPYREVPQRGWREEEWKQNTAVSCGSARRGNLSALTVVGQAQGVTPEMLSEIPWLCENASTIIFEERLDMTNKEGRMQESRGGGDCQCLYCCSGRTLRSLPLQTCSPTPSTAKVLVKGDH